MRPSVTTRDPALAARARITLLVSVGLTLLLYVIPNGHTIAYPLVLISTLVHELGHGIAALIAGGSFDKFQMFSDGSGAAHWSGAVGDAGRAFIAAGGLVGPAVGAAFCLILSRRPGSARACLGAIGALLVIAALVVVRNPFGWLFVGVLAAACLLIALWAGTQLAQLALVFLAVQLGLSVYSRGDYLFTEWADTALGRMPSDSQQMANAMGVGPYWFWGGLCGAFSVLMLLLGAWFLLRGDGPRTKARAAALEI